LQIRVAASVLGVPDRINDGLKKTHRKVLPGYTLRFGSQERHNFFIVSWFQHRFSHRF
jgi:hypothetical protein